MKKTLLFFALLAAIYGNAAVVTQNINYSLTAGVYQVDVNSNGTKDLFFRLTYNSSTQTIYCRFGVLDLNGSVNNGTGAEGNPVDYNAFWVDSMAVFTAPGGFIDVSSWCQAGDTCYIGFIFSDGGNLYHGWIQVSTVSANNLRIIRCAYNNVANEDLNFGETGITGILAAPEDETVTIGLINKTLTVTAADITLQGARLTISDLTGRVCLNRAIAVNENTVPVPELSSGVFVVSILTNRGKTISKKIVID